MAESLQNPRDANSRIDEIVSTLKAYLKNECDLVATEIVKAGSLGQGTAVPGEFDLDLIVYSADLKPEDVLANGLEAYLNKIHQLLQNHLSGNYSNHSLTNHALRFSYNGLEVDLLPSPYWSSPNDYYTYLKSLKPQALGMFSCTSAKWLKAFFLDQPQEVREYIRRAKKWRNEIWPTKNNSDGRPKSILMGLLVVEACGKTSDHKPASITETMKALVKDHNNLQIHWTDTAKYPSEYKSCFPSQPPYIIDPANPFNNVYKSGISHYEANSPEGTYEPGDGNWSNFVKNIDSLNLSA